MLILTRLGHVWLKPHGFYYYVATFFEDLGLSEAGLIYTSAIRSSIPAFLKLSSSFEGIANIGLILACDERV